MMHKLIIFDADGTLRWRTVEGQPCPNAPGEWKLMPNVKEVLAGMEDGIAYGIASNQAGVAYGYLNKKVAYRLLVDMFREAFGVWPSLGTIKLCPHPPDAVGCKCRKPKPQMLLMLMRRWQVRPSETLFVGDMESDQLAAENAGCDFMWAREFFGWQEI